MPSDDYTGGYVQNESILDVLYNAPEVNHTRLRTKDDLWGYCATCYYADVCKAGCTWTSHCTLGKSGNNPYCIHRAIEHEKLGIRETLVRAAPPPGAPFDYGRFAIKTEPWPEDDSENITIFGHDLHKILTHDWRAGSLWTDAQRREILKKAPRLIMPV